jgi:hypothetical protein
MSHNIIIINFCAVFLPSGCTSNNDFSQYSKSIVLYPMRVLTLIGKSSPPALIDSLNIYTQISASMEMSNGCGSTYFLSYFRIVY